VPLLQASGHTKPSFFVTNSHCPEEPIPFILSLSLTKAWQQNLIMLLNEAFGKDIHFGLVKVCGEVGQEQKVRNPANIAEKAVGLYEQEKGAWEMKVWIRE
jgi:hypothetical protein